MKKTPGRLNLVFTPIFIPILLIGIMLIPIKEATCQCIPPMSESCEESSVLCSLDELNGYTCNNPSNLPSPCSPLCSQGGVGHNTSWWAFVTQGGNQAITLNIGACTSSQGLQYGIWGDCSCGEEIACRSIPCVPPNSVSVVNVELKACKLYYLWVDGCSGDICDFTLNTTGGETPSLLPLGFINNLQNGIIEPVCAGVCNYRLFVNPQPGNCEPVYVWTIDGLEVDGSNNEIKLDFQDVGDFIVCVSAYIGNPRSGSLCGQTGPRCAIVQVRPLLDKTGVTRTLCWNAVNPGGYKWHSQRIFTPGIYREQFTDANCCKFDSIVEFKVLDKPEPEEVFYMNCDGVPYTDIFGRTWEGCRDKYEITLPKSTKESNCDSSILLTAIYPNFTVGYFDQTCLDGKTVIGSQAIIEDTCGIGQNEIKLENVRWYKKNDPTKTTIQLYEQLTPKMPGTYCVQVEFSITHNNKFKASCVKDSCYELKPDPNINNFIIGGPDKICYDQINTYSFDSLQSPGIQKYNWSVEEDGKIHTADPENNNSIQVSWNKPGIKKMCLSFVSNTHSVCFLCKDVEVIKAADAGRDFKVLGLQTKMKAIKAQSGSWKTLSGPGKVNYLKITDPNTRVSVTKVGKYIFEWSAIHKGCSNKDTVIIDFYKLPIYENHLIFFNNADENEFSKIEHRNTTETKFDVFTPNLIQTTGTTFIRLDESFAFEQLEYSWMDISGNVILKNKIHSESCTSICQIASPINTGMYFLFLKTDGKITVRKIIVMD